jgi:hypothetical protein
LQEVGRDVAEIAIAHSLGDVLVMVVFAVIVVGARREVDLGATVL